MENDSLINIGVVAQRTGVAVSAIRFYADKGLVPSFRNNGGHRVFPRSVIRRVSFILIAQNFGYTLNEIKSVLHALPENRTPNKADWDRMSRQFSQDIDEKIAQLENLRSSLSSCIGCGCLSLRSCGLYNPNDKISRRGTGPRYLLGDHHSD